MPFHIVGRTAAPVAMEKVHPHSGQRGFGFPHLLELPALARPDANRVLGPRTLTATLLSGMLDQIRRSADYVEGQERLIVVTLPKQLHRRVQQRAVCLRPSPVGPKAVPLGASLDAHRGAVPQ